MASAASKEVQDLICVDEAKGVPDKDIEADLKDGVVVPLLVLKGAFRPFEAINEAVGLPEQPRGEEVPAEDRGRLEAAPRGGKGGGGSSKTAR